MRGQFRHNRCQNTLQIKALIFIFIRKLKKSSFSIFGPLLKHNHNNFDFFFIFGQSFLLKKFNSLSYKKKLMFSEKSKISFRRPFISHWFFQSAFFLQGALRFFLSETRNHFFEPLSLNSAHIMHVCMYVCMLKGRPCGDVYGTDNRLGQGERSICGPIFPTLRAILARVTPPTSYYHPSAGSAANFALGTKGLPNGHRDQSGPIIQCRLNLDKVCNNCEY